MNKKPGVLVSPGSSKKSEGYMYAWDGDDKTRKTRKDTGRRETAIDSLTMNHAIPF